MTTHPTPTTAEYARLQRVAYQLLDAADQAARNGDTVTEQRAVEAAGRCLNATRDL
jgi:hypothetical protein